MPTFLYKVLFLGDNNENRGANKRKYLNFSKAKMFLKKFKFKNSTEYISAVKDPDFRKNNKLSTHPSRIYKDEWKDWADFLGKE